jgi:hypothetical protein
MRSRNLLLPSILISVLVLNASFSSYAQQTTNRKPLNLVVPNGKGRIIIPAPSDDVQWQGVNLYDQGMRPVFLTKNVSKNLIVSYALFPNKTGSSSPGICRDDVVSAGTRSLSPSLGLADIKQVKRTDHAPLSGQQIAVGSFFVSSLAGADVKQQNLYAVAASPTLCAEIHISKAPFQPTDEPLLTAQAETFTFEPDYTPSMMDYFTLGSIFFNVTKSFESAAIYYQRALDTLPSNSPLKLRRVITDQLAMSYGISGQIKQSRALNEDAIRTDPDYRLYYYNLACADAEQGKAADAKLHLQKAFDRKANTIPGEKLPDRTQDDSILKLKKNKEFWAFVQNLK